MGAAMDETDIMAIVERVRHDLVTFSYAERRDIEELVAYVQEQLTIKAIKESRETAPNRRSQ
jgi:hypothetical protein